MSANEPPPATSGEERTLRRELAKRRVFGFVSALAVVTALGPIREELDSLPALADDVVLLIVAAAALVLIGVMRDRTSLPQLRRQNNLLVGLWAVVLVFKVLGAVVERSDPADFADEIASMIPVVLAVLNRFVW